LFKDNGSYGITPSSNNTILSSRGKEISSMGGYGIAIIFIKVNAFSLQHIQIEAVS